MKKIPEGMWLNQDFCWSEKPQEESNGGMNMEAPEKIFVTITHPMSEKYVEMIAFEHGDGIQYTRTDAFIEKACDAYCKVCKMPNCRRNECKFISEFINYMKGE